MYLSLISAFAFCMAVGLLATAYYYLITWRVSKAGVRVKLFANIFDITKMFRAYRELAPGRGWSLWPIYIYWTAITFMFAGAIPIGIGMQRSHSGELPPAIRISPPFFLGWVSFWSLFLGVWFTYRVMHKLPRLNTGRRDWKRLYQDEFVRNDAYVVILSLCGLVAIWIMREQFTRLLR